MIKRILCLSLALLLALGALVGCKKGAEDSTADGTVSTQDTGADEEKLTILEGVNYGGKVVTSHVRGDDGSINEIGMESYGDILSDALYRRTVTTEERIGVDVEISIHEPYGTYNKAITELRNSITAQEGTYDIVAGWSCRIVPLTTEGIFHDLKSTAYYNSEDEWWSSTITDALTVGGKIYLNTGDIAASYMDSCMAIAVNQKVAKDFGYDYDSFYDIVDSGEWTMEYFNQLVKDAYHDENGNSIRDEQDKFGLVGIHTDGDAFWAASNISIIDNNGTDRPSLSFNVEKVQGMVDKVYTLFYDNIGAEIASDKAGVSVFADSDATRAHFQKDLAMFTMVSLGGLADLSTMETVYGVLPMPKYDADQKDYRTYVQQGMSLWCIPVDVADKDMSSAVMTSLGFDSRQDVIEVHYETVLKIRYVKDTTSGYMIDLIYNNVFMNFDSLFNEALAESVSKKYRVNMPVYVIRNMESELQSGKTNIQAWWASNETGLTTRLNAILDGYFGAAE